MLKLNFFLFCGVLLLVSGSLGEETPHEAEKSISPIGPSAKSVGTQTDAQIASVDEHPVPKTKPAETVDAHVAGSVDPNGSSKKDIVPPNNEEHPKPPITSTTAKPVITTTAAPITTTVAPTTTTVAPKPTPTPEPTEGKWVVNDTKVVCIVAQMAMQFNVSYVNSQNKTVSKILNMPSAEGQVNATGTCAKDDQTMVLYWPSGKNATMNNLTMHFVQNATEKHYSLHHLELLLQPTNFPDANMSKPLVLVHLASSFPVGLTSSYRCVKQQELGLMANGTNHTVGQLTVSHLQFQAFKTDNSTTFGLAKDCAFDTPDVVPIAVGCALAGLVVIVLIAYLVSRRRSQGRGYVSM